METKTLLIRYDEIGLKGRNRRHFENQLVKNIRYALKDIKNTKIDKISEIQTLVIDDGSKDNTVKVAEQNGVDHIVILPKHSGLATAFMAGIDHALAAGADIIVNTMKKLILIILTLVSIPVFWELTKNSYVIYRYKQAMGTVGFTQQGSTTSRIGEIFGVLEPLSLSETRFRKGFEPSRSPKIKKIGLRPTL